MVVRVRKYGGTSLADAGCLRRAARSVATARRAGDQVLVVVSAQGGATDTLLRKAIEVGGGEFGREIDQLLATGENASAALFALTLQGIGVPAVSLSAAQAGITVAGPAGAGRITDVDTGRMRGLLDAGQVVVVTGFQGINTDGDIVTLGRGGSDTTAVALAAELNVPECEIYTDVDGVCTADPRLVPSARLLPTIDPAMMTEMAFSGAKVMHVRAVELGLMRGIGIRVRSSFRDGPGTLIPGEMAGDMVENCGVQAVTHERDISRALVYAGPTRRDLAVEILECLAGQGISVDLIARSGPYEDEFRMGFTLPQADARRVADPLRAIVSGVDGTVLLEDGVVKISLVGVGLLSRPDCTSRLLSTLSIAGIASSWLHTSQLRVSVTVRADQAREAIVLLHKEFELESAPSPAR